MILSWYVLIPQRANSPGKALYNSLSFSYKNGFESLGNVVADQYYLRSHFGIIHRMGILDKSVNVSIIHI